VSANGSSNPGNDNVLSAGNERLERAMKRASDRPRDAVDLAELEELHGPG